MPLTLLIGGARAGKSRLAVRLAKDAGLPVTFIATAQASDREMAERITRHRAERPARWLTLEEPFDLERALNEADSDCTVIVDCLTLWVSNILFEDRDDEHVAELATEAAAVAENRDTPTFVVTNEVGAGVHPGSDLGRRFRDLLGRVNAIWCEQATDAFLVVAGRTITLETEIR